MPENEMFKDHYLVLAKVPNFKSDTIHRPGNIAPTIYIWSDGETHNADILPKIYGNGRNSSTEGYVSVDIGSAASVANVPIGYVRIFGYVAVVDVQGNRRFQQLYCVSNEENASKFLDETIRYPFERYIPRTILFKHPTELLPSACLTLEIEMTVSKNYVYVVTQAVYNKFESSYKIDEASERKKFHLYLNSGIGEMLRTCSGVFREMCDNQMLLGDYVELPVEELKPLRDLAIMMMNMEWYAEDFDDIRNMCVFADKYSLPSATNECKQLIKSCLEFLQTSPEATPVVIKMKQKLTEMKADNFLLEILKSPVGHPSNKFKEWYCEHVLRGFKFTYINKLTEKIKLLGSKSVNVNFLYDVKFFTSINKGANHRIAHDQREESGVDLLTDLLLENDTFRKCYSIMVRIPRFSSEIIHIPTRKLKLTYRKNDDDEMFHKCPLSIYANGRYFSDRGYVSVEFESVADITNVAVGFIRLSGSIAVVDAFEDKRFQQTYCISNEENIDTMQPIRFPFERYISRATLLSRDSPELLPDDCLTLDINMVIEKDFTYVTMSAFSDNLDSTFVFEEERFFQLHRYSFVTHLLFKKSSVFRAMWDTRCIRRARGNGTTNYLNLPRSEMKCFRNISFLLFDGIMSIDEPDELRQTCILAYKYGFLPAIDMCRQLIESSLWFVENSQEVTPGVQLMRQKLAEFAEDDYLQEILNSSRRESANDDESRWICQSTDPGFKFTKAKQTANDEIEYDFYK